MEVQPGSSFSCSSQPLDWRCSLKTVRFQLWANHIVAVKFLNGSFPCRCQGLLPSVQYASAPTGPPPPSRPACGHKTTGPPQAPKSRYVSSGIRSSAHPASSVTPGHSLFPNQITSELVCFGQWITDHACWRFPSPFLPYLWEYTVHDTTPLCPTVPIQASPCASSLSLPITPCRTPPWQENQSRTKTFE